MKLTTLVLLIFAALNCAAQTGQVKSFSFKKGEVMDVFLLTTAPNSEDKFERYKQTAFPVAFEYSYRPQKGFKITKLTLGTHTPSSLIFGKWESKEKREGFLANIAQKVPDFHQQRRVLFPYFDLTYYEMQHVVINDQDTLYYPYMKIDEDNILCSWVSGFNKNIKHHAENKKALVDFVKERNGVELKENALLIGFSRRAVAYKRSDFIFSDEEIVGPLFEEGKLQIVFSGRAHPLDDGGKDIVARLVAMSRKYPESVVFLENYDMIFRL